MQEKHGGTALAYAHDLAGRHELVDGVGRVDARSRRPTDLEDVSRRDTGLAAEVDQDPLLRMLELADLAPTKHPPAQVIGRGNRLRGRAGLELLGRDDRLSAPDRAVEGNHLAQVLVLRLAGDTNETARNHDVAVPRE